MKFSGGLEMKKVSRVVFFFDDGSTDSIEDPRACLLFQSRCNSNGIFSGMEEHIIVGGGAELKDKEEPKIES
jgi:hypothetical protein